jgi:hypothetical protein
VADPRGFDRDPPCADRADQLRPAFRKVAVCREQSSLRRLAPRLDRVARVGQDDDVLTGHDELAGVARRLLLALGQREPGQVAHVLAPDPEIRVDTGLREAFPEAGEACRPSEPVGLVPASQRVRGRRAGEVGRFGQTGRH